MGPRAVFLGHDNDDECGVEMQMCFSLFFQQYVFLFFLFFFFSASTNI